MTIVRVGTTQVYSEGWEGAFGKGKKPAAGKGKAVKPAAKKGKKKAKK